MPLLPGKSKKAFSKNVETEMQSGKPQDQSLAIAYGIKKKNKKKMARGGMINESAKSEQRPMPEEQDKDSKEISENSSQKSPKDDQWLDQPTVKQAQMNNSRRVMPIKHPKMAASDVVQVRLRDEEDDLQEAAKPMFEGGAVSQEASEEDHAEHPAGLEEDNDEMRPSKDEYMADHFADGGEVEEREIEHAASIAAAIMARRKMARGGEILSEDSMESDDSDMADLSRNAEEDANMEDKASFDALRKENYSESDALEESLHPEDSNLHGDEEEMASENKHDSRLVDAIRRKMRVKSPISR